MKSRKEPQGAEAPQWWNDTAVFARLVREAGGRAVRRAIREHHRAGRSVVIWRDGAVVELPPPEPAPKRRGGQNS